MFKMTIETTNGKTYKFIANGYKQIQTWLKKLYDHAAILSVMATRTDYKTVLIHTLYCDSSGLYEIAKPI